MRQRFSLPILLMIMSAFPVLSQERGADILSDIISTLGIADSRSSADVVSGVTGALDFIGSPAGPLDYVGPASPLDYISTSTDVADPYSALIGIYSQQENGYGVGALDIISGAYGATGFYKSGVFDNMGNSRYVRTSSVLPPMSGLAYYNPSWGRITSGYGYRAQFKRMHKGIDIAMSVGDTVRVALPGVVEKVTYEARGYGHYIVVRHDDGIETRYAHLSSPLVGVGQRVEANEPIALSGNTGNSTGPHLHFETRYQGAAVDPASVFDFTGNPQAVYYDSPRINPTPATMATGFNGSKKSLVTKSTYVVRDGDTPRKIASRAGISVLRLCQLNFITENQKLEPGTMLKLR